MTRCRRHRVAGVCILLSAVFALVGAAAPAAPARGFPAAARLFKDPLLDSTLAALARTGQMPRPGMVRAPAPAGFARVVVEPRPGALLAAESEIESLGSRVVRTGGGVIEALVPFTSLDLAARAPAVLHLRQPATPWPDGQVAQIEDPRIQAWQFSGYRGAGVKVAVVDIGFGNLVNQQMQGYMPLDVTVVNYCSQGAYNELHGSDVAQVVHAAAPDAELYLICVDSEVGLAQAEQYAEDHGIRIVNHSVTWLNTSRGDGSGGPGTPDATVARAHAHGILWVNAAGDDGTWHWGGAFQDVDHDGWHDFPASPIPIPWVTVFTEPDYTRPCAYLRWDEWPTATTDLDLYIRDGETGEIVAQSTSNQIGQAPVESLCYQQVGGYTHHPYLVMVRRAHGTGTPHFDLVTPHFGLDLDVPVGTIGEPASSPDAFAVGDECGRQGPWWSSEGPTIDGRIKPDLGAPSHPSGACGGGGIYQMDGASSIAAAHVSGAAALVMGRFPEKTADEVRAYLIANAYNPNIPLPNNQVGNGYLNLPLLPPTVNTWDPGMYVTAGRPFVLWGAFLDRATSASIGSLPVPLLPSYTDGVQFQVPDNVVPGVFHVTTPEGTATSTQELEVQARLDGIQPSGGCEGTVATLTGGGFLNTTGVSVANVPATDFHVVSPTQLTFTVPAIIQGGIVTVTTTGGVKTDAAGGQWFQLTPPGVPSISSVFPLAAAYGSKITVTGANLACGIALSVGLGEVTDYSFGAGGTKLTFTVPPGTPSGSIRLVTYGGVAVFKKKLKINGYPAITGFKPSAAPVGAVVQLTGRGFSGASAVSFGGVDATTMVPAGDGKMSVTVPPGAHSGSITIHTSVGDFASAKSFTVQPPPVPTIKSVSPTSGSVGKTVSISGKGLAGTTSITFNGVPATYTVIGDTKITTSVPAGATTGPLLVTAPGGTASKTFTVT